MDERNNRLQHLKELSSTLDSKFEGPYGIKFGLDALLGFVPVLGDLVTTGMSMYIIAQAAIMGVGPSTLVRMAINVGIESLVDMIPLFGNFFDIYWKANNKNIALIESHFRNPARETIKSRMIVTLLCFTIFALLIFSAYITFIVMKSLISWIMTLGLD